MQVCVNNEYKLSLVQLLCLLLIPKFHMNPFDCRKDPSPPAGLPCSGFTHKHATPGVWLWAAEHPDWRELHQADCVRSCKDSNLLQWYFLMILHHLCNVVMSCNVYTLLKMGCYVTPLGHYSILVILFFNNQCAVVPQGCNVAPLFIICHHVSCHLFLCTVSCHLQSWQVVCHESWCHVRKDIICHDKCHDVIVC